MRCRILHESPGRIRVHMMQSYMKIEEADLLETYCKTLTGVIDASVSHRTANVLIRFEGDRENVIRALSAFHYEEHADLTVIDSGRELSDEFENRVILHVAKRFAKWLFLPLPVRSVLTLLKSWRYILPGVKAILSGKIEVSVLDAATVGISMALGDFDTAADIMFLLGLSEILEEYTHRKSVDDLARSMSLNVDQVWQVLDDGTQILVPLQQIQAQDLIAVTRGSMIPLDGVVDYGSCEVNQASLTGESMPVSKQPGAYVYAGTVVEEGECVIRVTASAGEGRYDRIVSMIEDSEKLKSDTENRAAKLADGLVPWSFALSAAAWLFTGNINQALAVLMVDFSCAMKLSLPIAVLSAMRQASENGMMVKGGRFMEIMAAADTIVFDKTGTLTCSVPKVRKIVTFGKNEEAEVLRLAACLEEHFPHSIANAVVKEAERRGLIHEERHSKVEYVVAHGIVSHVEGKRVLIGSWHFIFEDEKIPLPKREREKFDAIEPEYSHLYLAIGGRLAAVICIEDPIRPEAPALVRGLRENGFESIVMMTGDSERTAKAVAQHLGIEEYRSEVLPEDKAKFIEARKAEGHTVLMIGDGINDTPALSLADAAISVSSGAAIAREIADITVPESNIERLVLLRKLSEALERRIAFSYRYIIGLNSMWILLGLLGILPAGTTAYLHNFSTLALSMYSMTPLKTAGKH